MLAKLGLLAGRIDGDRGRLDICSLGRRLRGGNVGFRMFYRFGGPPLYRGLVYVTKFEVCYSEGILKNELYINN